MVAGRRLALALAALLLASAALASTPLGPGDGLSYPLAPGSSLTLSYRVEGVLLGEEVSDSSLLEARVEALEWPEVVLSTVDGELRLPYAALALPPAQVGSERLFLPVPLPALGSGICLEARLEGRLREGLAYRGSASVGAYTIALEALYDPDGTARRFRVELEGPGASVALEVRVESAEPAGAASVDAEGWLCGDGVSSSLSYVAEGVHRLTGEGAPARAGREALAEALSGNAIVVIVDKRCPHCHRNWPEILGAASESPVPVYAIVAGPLMSPRDYALLVELAAEAGVTGTPAFIAFREGLVVAAREGYTPHPQLLSWIESVYG